MSRRWAESLLGILVILVIVGGGMFLGDYIEKNEEKLRSSLNLKPRLSNPSSKLSSSPQVPFSVTIGPDNSMTVQTIGGFSEDERQQVVNGLRLIFRASTDNMAHYFKYSSVVDFGSNENVSALLLVFSNELPRVSNLNGVKKVNWTGQRITFDVANRRMIYAVDGFFEFQGQEILNVKVFYASSLESRSALPPPVEMEQPKGEKF